MQTDSQLQEINRSSSTCLHLQPSNVASDSHNTHVHSVCICSYSCKGNSDICRLVRSQVSHLPKLTAEGCRSAKPTRARAGRWGCLQRPSRACSNAPAVKGKTRESRREMLVTPLPATTTFCFISTVQHRFQTPECTIFCLAAPGADEKEAYTASFKLQSLQTVMQMGKSFQALAVPATTAANRTGRAANF